MGLGRFFRRRRPAEPERSGPRAGEEAPGRAADPGSGTAERGTSPDDPAARAAELSYLLGQARPDEQRIAAVERLTELRAAGEVSEEDYLKEKRRLLRER